MYWYDNYFWGMHFFWWLFWFLLIVTSFSLLVPVRRRNLHLYGASPMDILQRRYAAGELTTEEYELRKARLQKDARSPESLPSHLPHDQHA